VNNDLSGRKVGDWIWTIRDGWMQIIGILKTDEPTIRTQGTLYTKGGKLFSTDKYPSAFLTPPEGFNAEPKPCEFKKGDRVLVSDISQDCQIRRHFFHVDEDGRCHCYAGGMSDWTAPDELAKPWKYCKKPEEGREG